jgi:hypothetical protein
VSDPRTDSSSPLELQVGVPPHPQTPICAACGIFVRFFNFHDCDDCFSVITTGIFKWFFKVLESNFSFDLAFSQIFGPLFLKKQVVGKLSPINSPIRIGINLLKY